MTMFKPRGESGALLVLALIFALVIAFLLLAVVNLSGSNLLNTANLQTERSLEYAADGAVDAAIQTTRYSALFATTSSTDCLPNGVPAITFSTSNPGETQYITVDCSGIQNGQGRVVNLYACVAPSATSPGSCSASNSVLTAQVDFSDNLNGVYACSSSPTVVLTTCGATESVVSWVVTNANS